MSSEFQPVSLQIEDIPPSFNALIQSRGLQWTYRKAKKEWEALFLAALQEAEMPRCDRVLVEGEITFPTRTRRDQGNYRFLAEKALGDALVTGGWLADDRWECFEFGNFQMVYEKGVKRLRLTLFPAAEREAA